MGCLEGFKGGDQKGRSKGGYQKRDGEREIEREKTTANRKNKVKKQLLGFQTNGMKTVLVRNPATARAPKDDSVDIFGLHTGPRPGGSFIIRAPLPLRLLHMVGAGRRTVSGVVVPIGGSTIVI